MFQNVHLNYGSPSCFEHALPGLRQTAVAILQADETKKQDIHTQLKTEMTSVFILTIEFIDDTAENERIQTHGRPVSVNLFVE